MLLALYPFTPEIRGLAGDRTTYADRNTNLLAMESGMAYVPSLENCHRKKRLSRLLEYGHEINLEPRRRVSTFGPP